jgi:hypothetical protein
VAPHHPIRAQPWAVAASIESSIAIANIHILAEASITTIVTTTLRTGYSTGYPGRIVVVPFVTPGALAIHSAFSGRITTASLSSLALAVTGPVIHTDVTTGMDAIPTDGMGIVPRDM